MTTQKETLHLIDRLAAEAGTVRPLASPVLRTEIWLALSLPFVAMMVILYSPRADLLEKLSQTRFLIEEGAALATAIMAALAAFAQVVPGSNRRVIWLAALPVGLWLATLGIGCLADWMRAGAAGLRVTNDIGCLGKIALIGSLPALAMVWMLRRGAPLAPRGTLFLAILAAAALGNFGLRLFHSQDAGLMVLIWQAGSVLLLAAGAGLCGPRFLCWQHRKA